MTVSSRSEYQFQTQYTSGHQGMAGLNFSNSDGLKLGSPLRNSGVLNAGGPPGCSLRRLYSPQLGAAAPYPTMPEAHILSKGSKNVLSRRSIFASISLSTGKHLHPCPSIADVKGYPEPAQMSRKILEPSREETSTEV